MKIKVLFPEGVTINEMLAVLTALQPLESAGYEFEAKIGDGPSQSTEFMVPTIPTGPFGPVTPTTFSPPPALPDLADLVSQPIPGSEPVEDPNQRRRVVREDD